MSYMPFIPFRHVTAAFCSQKQIYVHIYTQISLVKKQFYLRIVQGGSVRRQLRNFKYKLELGTDAAGDPVPDWIECDEIEFGCLSYGYQCCWAKNVFSLNLVVSYFLDYSFSLNYRVRTGETGPLRNLQLPQSRCHRFRWVSSELGLNGCVVKH